MKTLRHLFSIPALFVLCCSMTGDGAFDAQVNTIKAECRDMLGGARYEGAKVTYYSPSGSDQKKNVEVCLQPAENYIFAISGKKVNSSLTVSLYDAAPDVSERNLIREFKSVAGRNISFTSEELNRDYRSKVPEVEHIRNLHVEYTIGGSNGPRGAVVLVTGHQ